METTKFELDSKIVTRLKHKIILAESLNLKTKNKSEAQMVQYIKQMIEEEVKCCSDQ